MEETKHHSTLYPGVSKQCAAPLGITILSSQVKYGGVRNTNISGKCAALIWDHDFVEPNKMWRGTEN